MQRTIFGKYTYNPKTDFLGRGAFAEVYKAYDKVLNRSVALKFYKGGQNDKYNIIGEISKMQSLMHPNLIRYYDANVLEQKTAYGSEEQIQVGIMEYANHGNLTDWTAQIHREAAQFRSIDQKNQYIAKAIQPLIKGILEGLAFLHQHHILHRDIKPANILLHKEGEQITAKIADFGLSKQTDSSATSSHGFKGTIEYMAPEQIYRKTYAVGGKIQANADLWAFGIVLYELFARQIPVGRRSEGSTIEDIMENLSLFEPSQLVLQNIPPPYQRMIQVCLVKEAEKRVQTAEELLKLLGAPIAEDTLNPIPPIPKPKPTPPKPIPSPKPKQKEKQNWLFLIPIFLLIGIVGLWTSGIFSPSNPNPNQAIVTDSTDIREAQRIADSIQQVQLQKEQDSIKEVEAAKIAEEEARAKEKEWKDLLAAADVEYKKGNYKTAKKKYEEALKLDPNNIIAKKGLKTTIEKLNEISNLEQLREKYIGTWVHHIGCIEVINIDETQIISPLKHGICISVSGVEYEIKDNKVFVEGFGNTPFYTLLDDYTMKCLHFSMTYHKTYKASKFIYFNDIECKYSGDIAISNGKALGTGKIILPNGNSFEGYFSNDMPQNSYNALVNGVTYNQVHWDKIKNSLIPFEDKNGNKGHFDKYLNIIQ